MDSTLYNLQFLITEETEDKVCYYEFYHGVGKNFIFGE